MREPVLLQPAERTVGGRAATQLSGRVRAWQKSIWVMLVQLCVGLVAAASKPVRRRAVNDLYSPAGSPSSIGTADAGWPLHPAAVHSVGRADRKAWTAAMTTQHASGS